jgi:hypothetical protein
MTAVTTEEITKLAAVLSDPRLGAALLQNPAILALLPSAGNGAIDCSENPKKWEREKELLLRSVRQRVRDELTNGDPHLLISFG